MRILMISTLNLAQPNGGTAHFTSIAKGFRQSGHKVTAIIPKISKNECDFDFVKESFDFIIFSSTFLGRLISFSQTSINGILQVFKIIELDPEDYDWVYVRANLLSIFVILSLRLGGFKKIVTEHNGWFDYELSMMKVPKIFRKIVSLIQTVDAKLATLVRVVVPGIKQKLVDHGIEKDKIFVVGNGTDISIFFPTDKSLPSDGLKIKKDYFYLGFIGDLEPWQGVQTAIESMPIICNKYPNTCLLVIGKGREWKTLKQKYSDFKNVKFLGSVPYQESNKYINYFDIALLPKQGLSDIGYSPIKLYAYAAAGKPILASNISGIKELESAGFLVLHEPGNHQDLADKAISMMSDKEKLTAMGVKARQYAEDNFSWELATQKIIKKMQDFDNFK